MVRQLFWEIAEPCSNRLMSWMFFVGSLCFGVMLHWERETHKALQHNSDLLGLSFGFAALCCFFPVISGCFNEIAGCHCFPGKLDSLMGFLCLCRFRRLQTSLLPFPQFAAFLSVMVFSQQHLSKNLQPLRSFACLLLRKCCAALIKMQHPRWHRRFRRASSSFLFLSPQKRLIGPVTLWKTEVGFILSKRGFILYPLLSFGVFLF